MSGYTLIFSTEALTQLREEETWWSANRPKAPGRFMREMIDALDHIASMPGAGTRYKQSTLASVRRFVLRRTRYHVYYTTDHEERTVTLRAIWHASRGRGPGL